MLINYLKNLSNPLFYLAANAVNSVVPFLLLPILARSLSVEEYGTVALFQTTSSFLGALIGFMVYGAMTRKYYDKISKKEYNTFLAACVHVLIGLSIIFGIAIVVFGSKLKSFLGLSVVHQLYALLLAILNSFVQLQLTLLQLKGLAGKYLSLNASNAAISLGLSIFLILKLKMGLDGRVVAQLIASGLICVISFVWLKSNDNQTMLRLDFVSIKEILEFGIPLLPHVVGGYFLGSIDRVFVNRFLGPKEVGVYVVAVQISSVIGITLDAFNKSYVPWLFENLTAEKNNKNVWIVRITYLWFGGLFLSGFLAYMIFPPLVNLVAGGKYVQSTELVKILIFAQVGNGLYYAVVNYIFYAKQTFMLSLVSVFSGSLNVILLSSVLPKYGLNGASVVSVVSSFLQFALTWKIASKVYPMPWFSKKVFLK